MDLLGLGLDIIYYLSFCLIRNGSNTTSDTTSTIFTPKKVLSENNRY